MIFQLKNDMSDVQLYLWNFFLNINDKNLLVFQSIFNCVFALWKSNKKRHSQNSSLLILNWKNDDSPPPFFQVLGTFLKAFPKGDFLNDNFSSCNFPKVRLGPLRRRRLQGGRRALRLGWDRRPGAALEISHLGKILWEST